MRFIIKNIFFLLCLTFSFLHGESSLENYQSSEEEALFLRRIVEFWQEGEKQVCEKEIKEFLKKRENSDFSEYLYALLGDIYFTDKKFKKAKESYLKVEKKEIKEKILINLVQSFYFLKEYEEVYKESEKFIEYINILDKDLKERFYFLIADSYLQKLKEIPSEEKNILAVKAKEYFFEILHLDSALESFAKVLEVLKEYKKAANIYSQLVEKVPEKKENFLFKKAIMEVKFDEEKALNTFSQICHLGGDLAKDAAFNKMVLLMDLKKYSAIVLAKEQLEDFFKEDKKAIFRFYLAKSYFYLKDYTRAKREIKTFLEGSDEKDDNFLSALNMLLFCAEKEEDILSCDLVIEKYKNFYPKSLDLAKAYFIRGFFYYKNKDFQKAKNDFEIIEKDFKEFDDSRYVFEVAKFYFEIKDFYKARLNFKKFIEKYKNHEFSPISWKYFIASSIKQEETSSLEKKEEIQKIVLEDLEKYLKREDIENRKELLLYSAKIKFYLKRYEEVISDFKKGFGKYEDLKNDQEANFLLALSYKEKNDLNNFLEYSEKALLMEEKECFEESSLRIHLFNAYLEKSKKEESFLSKAADILFSAVEENNEILQENILWLGNYFYLLVKEKRIFLDQQFSKKEIGICKKAILVFEKSLENIEENLKKEIFLKLSDLYGYVGDYKNKKEVLEKLEIDEKDPFIEKIYFEFADSYKNLKESKKEEEFLKKVISLNKKSFYQYASLLALVRLQISLIDEKEFNLKNKEIVESLCVLKNLKLQKNLKYEPIHLEAALDYVDIQYRLEKDEEKKLKLLMHVKEDFSSSEDIISKDYQNSLELYPEKEKILKAYMCLIDAKIYALSYLEEENINNLKSKISSIYNKLKEKDLIVASYLENRFKKIIEETNFGKKEISKRD